MIKKISGQTALILILLTAAALIFLAITLNWGRIAQTKTLLTIAADQSASLLASDAASYGEMEKQTYLGDKNQVTAQTRILVAIFAIVIAIIAVVLALSTGGQSLWLFSLAVVSLVLAVVNLTLQLTVVQPGITALWNLLQKDQPIPQQFYEQGITTALQGSVGDRVNVTDYFDSNTNGIFGKTNNASNDTIGRFALFYTDRLKMLNQPPIPQVVFFYNQLGELMNGETCDQNANDVSLNLGVSPNPACAGLDCAADPIDPVCQVKIPNGFQLNDACVNSAAAYNPYCDPCCQPPIVPDPAYSASDLNPLHPTPFKSVRPSNCPALTPTDCSPSNPNADPNSSDCVPSQCLTNNPYGSLHPYIYDPTYQNYAKGASFLAQFGRDQQMGLFTTSLTPQGNFPNGIYPFFWLMNYYSPEVDNINPSNALQSSQIHWCAAGGSIPSLGAAPAGFPDLAQLNLTNSSGYGCQGPDCCVNFLADKVSNINGVSTPISDGSPSGTTNGAIDMAGSPSFGSNPGLDPRFGAGGSGFWLQGDNQMCLTTWPYNGANAGIPDGTCELSGSSAATPTGAMTVDGLDAAMHTLSDFVNFANTFLNNNVGTLSATFSTWYPQAADWIDPTTGRLPPLVGNFNTWNSVITSWLNNTYTSSGAWCVPQGTTGSTAEDAYINSNSSTAIWGDLPHVISCLNYNSNQNPAIGSVYNYQQCLTALPSRSCPSSLPAQCAASTLGRSLAGPAPVYDGCKGNYAAWVNNSFTLATDEAPKFALRAQFLNDVYTRARTMQNIFSQGAVALQNFLSGPAAQLMSASQSQPTATLPNSVIYGWVDNPHPNGQPGYAHIVKVTVYSVGHGGNSTLGVSSVLPWIKTKTSGFLSMTRSYTLENRDGPVYVGIKRWDEDHGNSILFPNGHPLWQFLFHNPKGGNTTTGRGLMQACNGLALSGGGSIGFGLEPSTVAGLGYAGILPKDQTALANAFMLNDQGNGKVDPYAKNSGGYSTCLSAADALLTNAPESHACAQYIASRNASGPSGNGDKDYSLKFFSCPQQPEDL